MTDRNVPEDSSLPALLRAHVPAPPFEDVDWAALHARTTAAAAPLLRRRPRTWWHVLGSGSHGWRTATAAAAIAVLVATGVIMPERPSLDDDQTEFRTIEEELALGVPYASVPLLAAEADNGAVIDALLLYDREDW